MEETLRDSSSWNLSLELTPQSFEVNQHFWTLDAQTKKLVLLFDWPFIMVIPKLSFQ